LHRLAAAMYPQLKCPTLLDGRELRRCGPVHSSDSVDIRLRDDLRTPPPQWSARTRRPTRQPGPRGCPVAVARSTGPATALSQQPCSRRRPARSNRSRRPSRCRIRCYSCCSSTSSSRSHSSSSTTITNHQRLGARTALYQTARQAAAAAAAAAMRGRQGRRAVPRPLRHCMGAMAASPARVRGSRARRMAATQAGSRWEASAQHAFILQALSHLAWPVVC
jgi:hypothetical protein